jgi:hypothetical protein
MKNGERGIVIIAVELTVDGAAGRDVRSQPRVELARDQDVGLIDATVAVEVTLSGG